MAQRIRRLPTEQEILGSSPSADEHEALVVASPCGLVVMTPA